MSNAHVSWLIVRILNQPGVEAHYTQQTQNGLNDWWSLAPIIPASDQRMSHSFLKECVFLSNKASEADNGQIIISMIMILSLRSSVERMHSRANPTIERKKELPVDSVANQSLCFKRTLPVDFRPLPLWPYRSQHDREHCEFREFMIYKKLKKIPWIYFIALSACVRIPTLLVLLGSGRLHYQSKQKLVFYKV